MGLYEINCVACQKPFTWFSGTMDQRCTECRKISLANSKSMKVVRDLTAWAAQNGMIVDAEIQSKLHEILVKEYGHDSKRTD
jgi:DNA-directed RNA polymerase subunit RPC12/RpoP